MYKPEKCKCGHSKKEHFNFIERLDEMKKPYWQYLAKGLGKCSICDCVQFNAK